MSFGLIKLNGLAVPEMPPLSTGTPSITINGELEALNEAPPRMRILTPVPGAPPPSVICTPATLPLINPSGVVMGPFTKSFALTVVIALVRSFLLTLP